MAMRLIVADSDESILERCKEYCSLNGIAMRTARGGVECLAELRRSTPDVLVLDAELPWGGGDGVLAVMGEDDSLARIPVVVLSRETGVAPGPGRFPPNVVGQLVKPLDVATLLESATSAADCGELFPRRPVIQRVPLTSPTRGPSAYQELASG